MGGQCSPQGRQAGLVPRCTLRLEETANRHLAMYLVSRFHRMARVRSAPIMPDDVGEHGSTNRPNGPPTSREDHLGCEQLRGVGIVSVTLVPETCGPCGILSFQCRSRFNAALVSMRAHSSGSTLRGCAFAHKLHAMPRDARRQRAAGCSCDASAPIRECCATAAGVLLAARALLGTRAGCVRHGCVKESESAGDPPLGLGSLGRAVQMSRRTICRRFASRFDNA